MMIRSRTSGVSAGGTTGCSAVSGVVTAGPGVRCAGVGEFVTGGTTRIVGAPFPVVPPDALAGRLQRDLGQVGLEAAVALDQTGDPHQHVAGRRRLLEGEVGALLELALGQQRPVLERTLGTAGGVDLDGRPGLRRRDGGAGELLLAAEVVDDADAVLEVPE